MQQRPRSSQKSGVPAACWGCLVCYMPLSAPLRRGVLGVLSPGLSLSACGRAARPDNVMCLCYSVIPHVERVLDDAADQLLREVGELRSEGRGKGVEVVALVLSDAARRDHFPDVRVVRFCGEGGAGAEEDRDTTSRRRAARPGSSSPTRPSRRTSARKRARRSRR